MTTTENPERIGAFLGNLCLLSPFRASRIRQNGITDTIEEHQPSNEAWLPEHDEPFADVNAAISTATLLVHPQPDERTEIWCDASNIAVGAVLVQLHHGICKPLSFWSRQLNDAQLNYSATDRELLTVSYAVDKFRSYLEG